MATMPSQAFLNAKVREEGQPNVFVVEEVDITGGMGQMQEAPVILIPGICQVHPDPDPATVTLGNENPCFVFTVRKTTTSKKSVLQELKTIRLVSDMMAHPIFLSSWATNNIPTVRVMRVKVKCILFFTFRLNDPSH